MKKERILREYFLVFQNLLCNYEAIFRKRSAYLCVVSVTTEIAAAVDACILTDRASTQSISVTRVGLAPHGFNMKACGFTVESDKVDAALPA